MRLACALLAVAVATTLFGCNRLPAELEQAAQLSAKRIASAGEGLEAERRDFAARLDSDAYAYLAPYAEREDWLAGFAAAGTALERARSIYASEVEPLLERNSGDDADSLGDQLRRIDESLAKLREAAQRPVARAAQLVDAREHAPERLAEGGARVDALGRERAALKTRADGAGSDYPAKAEDLRGRLAALDAAIEAASDARQRALALSVAGDADLAALADALAGLADSATTSEARAVDLATRMDELYTSYAKTLVDMNVDYAVVIGRTSWNELSDFAQEHQAEFPPRAVTDDVLAELDRVDEGPIFARRRPLIADAAWQALRIDPYQRLPRGDNEVELWVSRIEESYFHRYEIVEDGVQRQGDWEPVAAALFAAHIDDLGMDIIAKPYGTYADEALREAMPPGMAFVGNEKYGRWEDDGRGGRRWSWFESYLFYRLLFGGNHYYGYGGWNSWNRDYRGRAAYYGTCGAGACYGSRGQYTRASGRYASSNYARRGGLARAAASVRGAGPSRRGGGPGRGGK